MTRAPLRPCWSDALSGKVVMVCGVGPGLGRAIALRSADAGADLVLVARSQQRLHEVAKEIRARGRQALVAPTDISDAGARADLIRQSLDTFGHVDVLVNSAFVPPPRAPLLETDLDDIRGWTDTNVLASIGLVQQLAPTLVARRGSVVLINSMVLRNRLPGFGAYRTDKAALLAAARSLAVELGPQGVRVNSVAPGYIWADRLMRAFDRQAEASASSREQVYQLVASDADLRRLPTPEEIADAAVFLSSDLASGITGQCLDVNCGHAHH